VFTRLDLDVDGPEFMRGMLDVYDHTMVCPVCGGKVVWQSSPVAGLRLGRWFLALLLLGVLVTLAVYLLR
jgi:hypothetical protein